METLLNPAEAAVPVTQHRNAGSRLSSQFPLQPETENQKLSDCCSGGSRTCFIWAWKVQQPSSSVKIVCRSKYKSSSQILVAGPWRGSVPLMVGPSEARLSHWK